METLQDLKTYLSDKLSSLFGEGQFSLSNGADISDGFFIRTNFTPKNEWQSGIWDNGKCSIISVHPLTRWEKDNGGFYAMEQIRCSYKIEKKLRTKNKATLEAIGKAIVKWVEENKDKN